MAGVTLASLASYIVLYSFFYGPTYNIMYLMAFIYYAKMFRSGLKGKNTVDDLRADLSF